MNQLPVYSRYCPRFCYSTHMPLRSPKKWLNNLGLPAHFISNMSSGTTPPSPQKIHIQSQEYICVISNSRWKYWVSTSFYQTLSSKKCIRLLCVCESFLWYLWGDNWQNGGTACLTLEQKMWNQQACDLLLLPQFLSGGTFNSISLSSCVRFQRATAKWILF